MGKKLFLLDIELMKQKKLMLARMTERSRNQ